MGQKENQEINAHVDDQKGCLHPSMRKEQMLTELDAVMQNNEAMSLA